MAPESLLSCRTESFCKWMTRKYSCSSPPLFYARAAELPKAFNRVRPHPGQLSPCGLSCGTSSFSQFCNQDLPFPSSRKVVSSSSSSPSSSFFFFLRKAKSHVAHAGLVDPPVPIFQMLGLQAWTTMSNWDYKYIPLCPAGITSMQHHVQSPIISNMSPKHLARNHSKTLELKHGAGLGSSKAVNGCRNTPMPPRPFSVLGQVLDSEP